MRPQSVPDSFNPGRGVNQSCLDHASGLDETDGNVYRAGCILIPGDAVQGPVLINHTEYLKTVGNLSDFNQVYLSFHEGLQYSVLAPAHIPGNFDFQAATYGSHTECRMVTTQCGAVSHFGEHFSLDSDFNFACNKTIAGLNMTGNFENLGLRKESYSGSQQQNASSTPPTLKVENVNTMSQSNFGFGFQYFNDSAKQEQVQTSSYGLGEAVYGPITSTTNQYFWGMAFSLDIQLHNSDGVDVRNPWGRLNVVADAQGGAEGIMSCKTNISEIVRLADPLFHNWLPSPLPPYTYPIPLVQPTLTSPSLSLDL